MKVKLLKSMTWDGKKYESGDIVDMDDSTASALVGSSAASYKLDDANDTGDRSRPTSDAHRFAAGYGTGINY